MYIKLTVILDKDEELKCVCGNVLLVGNEDKAELSLSKAGMNCAKCGVRIGALLKEYWDKQK